MRLSLVLTAILAFLNVSAALADDEMDVERDEMVIQRLPDAMYEMIRERFPDADVRLVILEFEDDEAEIEVILVADGDRYEVEFGPGEDSIDDDNVERLEDGDGADTDDHYDDDQHG